ncbi:srg family chemoreceptor domain-containing protein [Ditylenchus destructor]|uniref:Serpentine receptor class gamma n=1 Tax=Ditylenchus destructor TaxID=166010 RepID=A0AAD4QYR7_9BILA|nr:srg family chemoreceptor domain-containing protein [Ditylenchus destructor]
MGAVMSEASYPPFIFSLLISIPSIILYTVEVIILIGNKKNFRSAFFHIFIVRYIASFLGYFTSLFGLRLQRVGLFRGFFESLPSPVLGILFFFNNYAYHTENLLTMFLLVNRLTLMIFPLNHKKIWKYLFPITIIFTVIIPLPFTVPTLAYNYFIRLQMDGWTFTIDYQKEVGVMYIRSVYVNAASGVLFCVICGLLNFLTIFFYRRNRKINLMSNVTLDDKIESRLTIYALITFFVQFISAIHTILIYIAANSIDYLYLSTVNQSGWISDISTIVVPSWFLLWASSGVKEAIYKAFKVHKWPLIGRSINTNNNNTTTVVANVWLSFVPGNSSHSSSTVRR